ncbi:MAG: low-specificity L-threonine aldolase [Nitrospinae bacterium]|nr:low-specificity L-threonine aldolase [Nitrospinota bacterium]
MKPIDLRSDTVTHPTEAMRSAMAGAVVGDDVFGEDPTLNDLEALAAQKTGKQAAVFVPSGTMGNLISVLAHCARGDEVILGDRSHIFLNEVAGMSALGGIHPHIIPNNDDGTLPLDVMEKAVRHSDIHYPPTHLICLENTHNYCQGAPLTPEYMQEVAGFAEKHSLKIHLDGARIFNAAVALNIEVSLLVRHVDSVMFCLSKGLSAPVGSLVCGTEEFIWKARKLRKMVGGGMRQAGHLAAAGRVALENQIERLKIDHQLARELANGLAGITGFELNLQQVKTNIIFFQLNHPKVEPEELLSHLESEDIKILMIEPGIFRAVLHREISQDQIFKVLEVCRSLLD